jgi:hypothetical protein
MVLLLDDNVPAYKAQYAVAEAEIVDSNPHAPHYSVWLVHCSQAVLNLEKKTWTLNIDDCSDSSS